MATSRSTAAPARYAAPGGYLILWHDGAGHLADALHDPDSEVTALAA